MKRAIVVGGGPAGTSAAFRLQQAGFSVCLLERDAEIGGRTRSIRKEGFILDIAAGLMPGTYREVYRLMEDAGLKDMFEPMLSPTAIVRDGRFHYLEVRSMTRSMLTTPLLSAGAKFKLLKLGAKAMRMWSALDFEDLGRAAAFDDESLEQYAKRELNAELYEYLLNPMQKIMYTMSGADASVVDFFWCMKNLTSPDAFCVKGGMGRIVGEISRHLDVRLDSRVTAVTERADKVEVQWLDADGREQNELVDVCVIATPSRDVPAIDRGLSPASRDYLTQLRFSYLTDLHLRLRERPAERAVLVMVPDDADRDLCGILLDHNKGSDRAPPGKGSLSVYFSDPWAQQAYHWPDEQVYTQGMAKLERVMPGIGALVEGYHVQRWDHAATLSSPGHYRKLAQFEAGLDLQRRVQLAGDYFSLASVNTAVTSGRLAAERLTQRYA